MCSDLWFVLIFLTYPSTCATIFKFFAYDSFNGPGEDGTSVLHTDPSVVVGSPLYYGLLVYAIPMFVAFPIGVPVLYFLLLFRSRGAMHEIQRIELIREAEYSIAKREEARLRERIERQLAVADAQGGIVAARSGGDNGENGGGSSGSSSGSGYGTESPNYGADDGKDRVDGSSQLRQLEEQRMSILREAKAARKATKEWEQSLRDQLPSDLRKLTAGYEMRCYGFECFECIRKILIVGVPVFFSPGTPIQLVVGLLNCFITSCIYAAYRPFEDDSDDLVSAACQISIFLSLLASVVTNAYPNDPTMSVILPVLLVAPAVLAVLTAGDNALLELLIKPCLSGGDDDDGSDGGGRRGERKRPTTTFSRLRRHVSRSVASARKRSLGLLDLLLDSASVDAQMLPLLDQPPKTSTRLRAITVDAAQTCDCAAIVRSPAESSETRNSAHEMVAMTPATRLASVGKRIKQSQTAWSSSFTHCRVAPLELTEETTSTPVEPVRGAWA